MSPYVSFRSTVLTSLSFAYSWHWTLSFFLPMYYVTPAAASLSDVKYLLHAGVSKRQNRMGLRGNPLFSLKFRSMITAPHACVCVCLCVCVLATQLWPTLCDPTDCSSPGSSAHGALQSKNTGVGSHSLQQGIFPTQGLNLGLLHWRQILYYLSHQRNPNNSL